MNVSAPQDDSVGYIAEIGVYVYTDIHICTHVLSHSIYCRECNILYIHVHIISYTEHASFGLFTDYAGRL